ncbi:MAG: cob(I)yrinic acid a,c-diamide adenosyltransferase [Bacteroidales bacterium]|jgi:cob(I)alamin adenosyltransferase|nr:cob(I)yrinic acid a,c-diamide adenosyltransferase [Bacteroidales bacterium]
MKIYTKTGDKGETSLIGGRRVLKSDVQIEAYGTIDELNSVIGMILNFDINEEDKNIISFIQNRLFDIGCCLAVDTKCEKNKIPDIRIITENDIHKLEKAIDEASENLSIPKSFIIPAGSFLISWCNVARTVCRRAERRMFVIEEFNKNYANSMVFVNRLSDFLFIMGRKFAKENNIKEILWNNCI